ncbi:MULTISPECIES: hypothetical protein [Sphingomonas]|uniref:hypothetical protein n=1 Tax=Sphingomonas TaxID=13687 RepID=UPI000DEFCC32|nr:MULTISPECIES: hypothetical protein [Sphingomonas]
MKLLITAAILAIAAGTNLPAQTSDLTNLKAVAIMHGRCRSLVVAGKDASRACSSLVTNSMYRTGRGGFVFTAGDLAVVTFSGFDTGAQGDIAEIKLDHVIFSLIGTGTPRNTVPATGTCTYTNPYAGPSHITCTALTKSGRFAATFLSNGQEPEFKRF